MIDKIYDAISKTLSNKFGNKCEIYGDCDVEQGLTEPCFLIKLINSSRQRIYMTKRFRAHHNFIVYYFPENKKNNTEMQAVAETLFESLELISGDNDLGTIRASNMRFDISNGVLNFLFSYDFNIYIKNENENEDYMEILNLKQEMI
jgi:hypothetical protein